MDSDSHGGSGSHTQQLVTDWFLCDNPFATVPEVIVGSPPLGTGEDRRHLGQRRGSEHYAPPLPRWSPDATGETRLCHEVQRSLPGLPARGVAAQPVRDLVLVTPCPTGGPTDPAARQAAVRTATPVGGRVSRKRVGGLPKDGRRQMTIDNWIRTGMPPEAAPQADPAGQMTTCAGAVGGVVTTSPVRYNDPGPQNQSGTGAMRSNPVAPKEKARKPLSVCTYTTLAPVPSPARHNDGKNRKVPDICAICNAPFYGRGSLTQHMHAMHPEENYRNTKVGPDKTQTKSAQRPCGERRKNGYAQSATMKVSAIVQPDRTTMPPTVEAPPMGGPATSNDGRARRTNGALRTAGGTLPAPKKRRVEPTGRHPRAPAAGWSSKVHHDREVEHISATPEAAVTDGPGLPAGTQPAAPVSRTADTVERVAQMTQLKPVVTVRLGPPGGTRPTALSLEQTADAENGTVIHEHSGSHARRTRKRPAGCVGVKPRGAITPHPLARRIDEHNAITPVGPLITPSLSQQESAGTPLRTVGREASGAMGRCPVCAASFGRRGALLQHMRNRHALRYHEEQLPQEQKKAQWSREELVVLAREEVRLTARCRPVNSGLRMLFPFRTIEAIKGQRRQPAYRALVREFKRDARMGAVDGWRPVAPATDTVLAPNDERTEGVGTSEGTGEEFASLWEHISSLREQFSDITATEWDLVSTLTQTGLDLHPNDLKQMQSIIDREYRGWFQRTFPDCANKPGRKGRAPVSRRPLTRAKRIAAHTVSKATTPLSARKRRRRQYAEIQRLYKTDRGRCADEVLTGAWAKDKQQVPMCTQEDYWGPLMEETSLPCTANLGPGRGPVTSLYSVISDVEVEQSLKTQGDGAPGRDRVARNDLRAVPPAELATHFNFWLVTGLPPSAFKSGYTTLVPKVARPTPSEHRPITVSSMVARAYHRVLAARMERSLPVEVRQKGFRRGDGLRDNIWLLRSLLSQRTTTCKPLCVAFVDVAKAFDSVSHDMLIRAAKRMGVPDRLIQYIRVLYTGGTTHLKVGGRLGRTIRVGRGIRQGDPLSSILFNFVMDYVLSRLDNRLGVQVAPGKMLNRLAFADDVALLSESETGLKRLAKQFEQALATAGLRPNAKKSATLRISVNGKMKRWVCNPKPFITLAGEEVPALSIDDAYRYLGTYATLGKTIPDSYRTLLDGLHELSRAPLKPQQRMYLLRVHLIPSLFHQLGLGDSVTKGMLGRLDRLVRKFVRQWLKFPKDAPIPLFYARASDGGLGLQELQVAVPLQRRRRLERMIATAEKGGDEILTYFTRTAQCIERDRKRWENVTAYGTRVGDTQSWRNAAAEALYSTCDGKGLRNIVSVPGVHKWVTDGGPVMSGRSFISAVLLRSNLLTTGARKSRGRPDVNPLCDCRAPEYLGHILQECEKTWEVRNLRHNQVLDFLAKRAQAVGWSVELEPRIRTSAGLRIPDLILHRTGSAVVCDLSIVSDLADLDKAHRMKVKKYGRREIRVWAAERAGIAPDQVTITAAIFSWRGGMAKLSWDSLMELGLDARSLEIAAIRVIEEGFGIYLFHRRCTTVGGRISISGRKVGVHRGLRAGQRHVPELSPARRNGMSH